MLLLLYKRNHAGQPRWVETTLGSLIGKDAEFAILKMSLTFSFITEILDIVIGEMQPLVTFTPVSPELKPLEQ